MWQGLDFVVDMDSRRELLELVAGAVVATIKLHPRWYGGSYRVWLGEPVAPWKLKVSVYFNYNDRGARTHTPLRWFTHCAESALLAH